MLLRGIILCCLLVQGWASLLPASTYPLSSRPLSWSSSSSVSYPGSPLRAAAAADHHQAGVGGHQGHPLRHPAHQGAGHAPHSLQSGILNPGAATLGYQFHVRHPAGHSYQATYTTPADQWRSGRRTVQQALPTSQLRPQHLPSFQPSPGHQAQQRVGRRPQYTDYYIAPQPTPAEEYLPPSQQPVKPPTGDYLPPSKDPVTPPTEDYLPPSEEPVKPPTGDYLPPSNEPVKPPTGDYLPPGKDQVTPPTGDYLPPSQDPVKPPTGDYLPPSKDPVTPPTGEYLPPSNEPVKPPTGDYLPPSKDPITPPTGEYLPPSQEPIIPPNAEYLPPTEPISPPADEYLPPQPSDPISAPAQEYLPPDNEVPLPSHDSGYLPPSADPTVSPPLAEYLPPAQSVTSQKKPTGNYSPQTTGRFPTRQQSHRNPGAGLIHLSKNVLKQSSSRPQKTPAVTQGHAGDPCQSRSCDLHQRCQEVRVPNCEGHRCAGWIRTADCVTKNHPTCHGCHRDQVCVLRKLCSLSESCAGAMQCMSRS